MFFFWKTTPTWRIYTLSLHDALPILDVVQQRLQNTALLDGHGPRKAADVQDRKSTRLNSSHTVISYAVFCLKKKNRLGREDCPRRPQPCRHSDRSGREDQTCRSARRV